MFLLRLAVIGFLVFYGWNMGQFSDLNDFGKVVAGSFFVTAPILYFLPSYEAWLNRHPKIYAVFTLNLLLGWTLIGWVAAIVWALTHNPGDGNKRDVFDLFKAFYGVDEPPPSGQHIGNTKSEGNGLKKCPYCAEDIKIEAIKCKHCQSELSTSV
ncbi:superinfection immunity protein [Herbaspirillum huttiense]|uniref:superinfection immunity protein n=1 Tax=Herbaspirillum huttiense TaxID=863372 RepID=UPI0039AE9D56